MRSLFVVLSAFFSVSAGAQGYGFTGQVDPDLSLAPGGAAMKNLPAVGGGRSLKMTETLTTQSMDFIHGILASGRVGHKLKCRIEVSVTKEERKFSTGSQWVESIDIRLFTDHFGPRSLKFSFPVGSRLGRRVVNNQDYGQVEEIKIESPEPYENFFQFQHDGTRVVWAEIGSMYNFAPCLEKRD